MTSADPLAIAIGRLVDVAARASSSSIDCTQTRILIARLLVFIYLSDRISLERRGRRRRRDVPERLKFGILIIALSSHFQMELISEEITRAVRSIHQPYVITLGQRRGCASCCDHARSNRH